MSAPSARLLLDTLCLDGAQDPAAARHAWSQVDPGTTAALAVWEGGVQWLLRRLRESGLDNAAPPPLQAALRKLAMDEQARSMLVDAETLDLLRYLAARGVPSVLIKGPARRAASGLYPYADARATQDVDVLLPAEHVQEVWHDLRRKGWPYATDPGATPPGHYHPPPLRGPIGVAVELHSSTGDTVPPAEAWRRATEAGLELEWNRMQVRVPSATELLWHGLTHALEAGPFGFRLRYLLDGAAILASRAMIDWEPLVARLAAGVDADPWLGRAWLRAAAELAGCGLPASLRGASASFVLERALSWRLAVFARAGSGRFTARLLEEGTRAELGLGVRPVIEGTSPLGRTRRFVAGKAARVAYGAWRLVARRA